MMGGMRPMGVMNGVMPDVQAQSPGSITGTSSGAAGAAITGPGGPSVAGGCAGVGGSAMMPMGMVGAMNPVMTGMNPCMVGMNPAGASSQPVGMASVVPLGAQCMPGMQCVPGMQGMPGTL